ncbi:transporter Na+/H+ antiporter family [Neocallimastix lanati (nom. inval.)]|jgi:Na+/H+ antiporter NhaC|uniref:Transporter Na+/H+ antiporter family n=1 Tax=Neocallimastix californiae TaxID=1754190 RepID=A0A1Y2BY67_9FUNG|nr:transporter Na+/H+ antiporter family [Neocallimastix sp. JGI-2020a]ORY39686.1 transporter Na+/H+ antiporter family [Neocallimastix californiae]|eukprot:ORY39686.1 transporter Na+/H+ antiporter family [Neocallimastix californiae]
MSVKKAVIICTTIVLTILALFAISFIINRSPSNAEKADRYGILSILPPLVAIVLAFITKATVLSLFIGVFIGEFMVNVTNMNIAGSFVNGFLSLGSQVISSMADQWNAGIILQCLLIGGVIHLIAKMGGAKALAEALAKRANTPRKAQIITEILGLLVFFDDYANSLIVGPIMRPVMDKLRVSREKLAFLVDATAAPVAGIAIISTWIGLEVSLIADGFKSIGREDVTGFDVFLKTIPFRFYNILILIFVAMTALTLIEFGPMKKAEQKARKREDDQPIQSLSKNKNFEEVKPVEGVKLSIWNAIIPILTLVISALIAFYWSGYTTIKGGEDKELIDLMKNSPLSIKGIFEALSNADASVALFQSALFASIVSIIMAAAQKILSIDDAIGEWINGMKTIVITGVILLLAWSLGGVIKELGTADYLVSVLKNAIPKFILPTIIFVLSAIISFATGTSYGTMSILMPLTIPLAWAIKADMDFAIICTSGVLTGAIFGDHCSPISDTTILSSMGTSCDHIAHVQTQIYYTLYVAIITIIVCYLPAGFGISWYITLPIAVIVMYIGLRLLGEKVPFNSDVVVDVPNEIIIEDSVAPKGKNVDGSNEFDIETKDITN